jgi:hypothetical protein
MGLILSETKLQRWQLAKPTPARTGVDIVVQTATGRTELVRGQRTVGESLFAPHSMQYEVDTSDQNTRIETAVKTKEDAYAFQVVVDVVWRVVDAAEVVRRRLNDGSVAISTVVRDRLKELGRQFSIEQTVEFEHRLRDEFAGPRAQVGCLRILLVTPDVTLDAPGTTQLAEVRAAQGQTMIIQAKHGNEVLRQRNSDELAAIARQHEVDRQRISREYEIENQEREEARQRREREYEMEKQEREDARRRREQEWKKQLAIEEAEFQAELEHRAARRKAELAAWEAQERADLELQQKQRHAAIGREQSDYELTVRREDEKRDLQLERERTALFQQAIEHGDPAMLAVHLGMHPGDAKEFILAVAKDKTATAERNAALLSALIERKIIINADLDGISQELIRAVTGIAPPPNDRHPLTATVEDGSAKTDDGAGRTGTENV